MSIDTNISSPSAPSVVVRPTSSSSVTSSPGITLRKSGHLYKKSGLRRTWRTCFFSLEGNVLYYYKREGDSVPQGIVVLTGCKVKVTKDKKYYSFHLSHPQSSKTYDLAATLESRTQDWIDILREAAELDQNANNSRMLESSDIDFSSRSIRFNSTEYDAICSDGISLPDEYKECMELLMIEFLKQSHENANGWKLKADERNVKVYSFSSSRIGSVKGIGFIQQSPHVILNLLLDPLKRKSFDPQLQEARRLHVFDEHTFIDYLLYKPVFPTFARDFINLTHWRVLKDDSILLVATAYEKNDFFCFSSLKNNIIRGKMFLGGFLIQPNQTHTGCQVIYLTKVNLKGDIPTNIQANIFIKQTLILDEMRRVLQEEEEKEKEKKKIPIKVSNSTLFNIVVTSKPQKDQDFEENNSIQNTRIKEDEMQQEESESENENEEKEKEKEFFFPEEGMFSIPKKYHDTIEKTIQRMEIDMSNQKAWNFHSENKGIKAFTKIDGSLTAALGIGFLPFSPRVVWDMIIDITKKKQIDSNLLNGKRLVELDQQTFIDYLEYKPILFVAGRDFCNLVHWRVLSNGTIIIVAQSIEDINICPLKEPKVVRGDVHLGGWKIVPNAQKKGCDVTFMVKTDLKGSIPSRIASKVAAEQPFLIQRIGEVLQKNTASNARLDAKGPLKNTILKHPPSHSKTTTTTTTTTKNTTTITTTSSIQYAKDPKEPKEPIAEKEPEVETEKSSCIQKNDVAPQTTKEGEGVNKDADFDVLGKRNPNDGKTGHYITYAAQFIIGVYALKGLGLSGFLHTGGVLLLVAYVILMLFMGPSHMSPRRKLMIATWSAPDSGNIYGTLSIDVSKTLKYIQEKRTKTDTRLTITHVVLRAVGVALGKAPSVNGHLVFGNYYQAPSVDVSCLIAIDGGKDLGMAKLTNADQLSYKEVCDALRSKAGRLRSGKNKDQDDRNKLMSLMPTFLLRPLVNVCGWLGGALGLQIKALGIDPYMFGAVCVTSVGMMGLDLAFSPISPYTQVPMLITVGAITEKPVVVDGTIVSRPILTITATIDHRYVDGSQAARMAQNIKRYIEDPSVLEPADA